MATKGNYEEEMLPSPTTTHGSCGPEVPGKGEGSGNTSEPFLRVLPKQEFEKMPPSLWRPTSPRSIKMNLKKSKQRLKAIKVSKFWLTRHVHH